MTDIVLFNYTESLFSTCSHSNELNDSNMDIYYMLIYYFYFVPTLSLCMTSDGICTKRRKSLITDYQEESDTEIRVKNLYYLLDHCGQIHKYVTTNQRRLT